MIAASQSQNSAGREAVATTPPNVARPSSGDLSAATAGRAKLLLKSAER